MKHFFISLLLVVSICGTIKAQPQSDLQKKLWAQVEECYGYNGENSIFSKTDDSKNGYLQVSGMWPTCGCYCRTTAGAYKNSTGNYIILKESEYACSWKNEFNADTDLKNILPENFNINTFIPDYIDKPEFKTPPHFFLRVAIPQKGTDTKITLELLPFGIKTNDNSILVTQYNDSSTELLTGIKSIATKIKDSKTFDLLLKKDYQNISAYDLAIIKSEINDQNALSSFDELSAQLEKMKYAHEFLNKIVYDKIILGWDKNKTRFYVKTKIKSKQNPISFIDFLKKHTYWVPYC